MDILGDFLADSCVLTAGTQVTSADLNRAYKDWCERGRHKPMSGRGHALKERGFTQERTRTARTWVGLGLSGEW